MNIERFDMVFLFTQSTFRLGKLGNLACESNWLESRLRVVNCSSLVSDRRSLVEEIKEKCK